VRLISEMKRRNVFRMALLYVVVAWLVMQVAEVVIGLANLPEWIGPAILAALAVGFPIALVISWFYEITPEGLALEKDVPEGASITHATGRRMDFIVIAVLSAGLILFAGDKWWPRGPMELSIAVMPFANMSGDTEQEYFADGISEEILNLLAYIRPLKVIARTSSFSFKGKDADIATISEQLNTRYVLEGSVRRGSDTVRITAQLIDAKDSTHIWSATYDRNYSAVDLLHIQSEVARAVTDKLRITLTGEDEARLAKVPTENTEAYTAYLIGRQRLADRKVRELGEAAEQFARAIELDPKFAAAYSGLADACWLYFNYSGGNVHSDCPASDPGGQLEYDAVVATLARKAVELDEHLGEAWLSWGHVLATEADSLSEVPWSGDEASHRTAVITKLKEAHAAFERGLSLNPSHTQGYLWYAQSIAWGVLYSRTTWEDWLEAWKADKWQSVVRRGLELDPLSIPLHMALANWPVMARSKDEVFFHASRIIEIAPDSPIGYHRLGKASWGLSGRIDEAIKWWARAAELDSDSAWFPELLSHAYATLGDLDMAMAYAERAAQMYVAEPNPGYFAHGQAKILLGSKDNLQPQLILDLLQQVDPQNNERLEAEAQLAIITGNAAEWLSSREDDLSPCLTAEIDRSYVDNLGCEVWLDRVLQLTNNERRALTAVEERINAMRVWLAADWPYKSDIYGGYAMYYAMLGKKDEALDFFEKLVRSGWRGDPEYSNPGVLLRFVIYHDTTLDPIRDHPRFQALVSEVEADLAQQLENVREMERKGELLTLEEVRAGLSIQ
jgi:TolB-like protein